MTFANSVLQEVLKDKGRAPAVEALKRHGPSPEIHAMEREADLFPELVRAIERLQVEAYSNIAIITKTAMHGAQLADELRAFGYSDFELVNSDARFNGGVVIVPVHLAKGMEFEASLVAGVDARTYTETEFDGRLLYVALTRALQVLHIFWVGEITPHLERAVAKLVEAKEGGIDHSDSDDQATSDWRFSGSQEMGGRR